MLNPMRFYTILQYDPRARESNTIRKARSYNNSQSAVHNTYNICTDTLFPVLFFCHNIHRGMGVAGSPLFDATILLSFSFGLWEQLPATGITFIWVLRWQKMRFLLFALGSVTGRCFYLGSLNRGCKGWEGSRDNLYLGLPSKRSKV